MDEIISTTEETTNTSIEVPKEDCKPCRLNIGAAMMITVCRDLAAKDPDFGMDCKLMEQELTEKEEAAASHIIDDIYNAVMEKGTQEDKEVAKEIYDLSKGKEAVGGE